MLIKPFTDITISHDHYVDNDAGLPGLNLTEEYDTRVRRVNFLEQAFEWDIMAYKFFPYFYANQKDWYTLMHVDGTADEVFKSFLSSGMAKVKLPVRMGYENAVQYFLNTGEIWQGSGFVLDSDEDLDISINEEIDTGSEEVVIEESWRTRIPTSLSIVQKDGKALDDDGLPCHDDASGLAKGHSVLVGAPTEI